MAGKKNDSIKEIKGNNRTGKKFIEASWETWAMVLSNFVHLFGAGWGGVHTADEIKNKQKKETLKLSITQSPSYTCPPCVSDYSVCLKETDLPFHLSGKAVALQGNKISHDFVWLESVHQFSLHREFLWCRTRDLRVKLPSLITQIIFSDTKYFLTLPTNIF